MVCLAKLQSEALEKTRHDLEHNVPKLDTILISIRLLSQQEMTESSFNEIRVNSHIIFYQHTCTA
jgi:hypothetical protein